MLGSLFHPNFLSIMPTSSATKDANTSGLLDFGFSLLCEVSSLHDNRLLWKLAFTHHFHVPILHHVDNWSLGRIILVLFTCPLWEKCPDLIDVDGGDDLAIFQQMEVAHTDLSKVSWVILVEVDSVVVLTTSITTASRVFTMLADTSASS